MSLNTVTMQFMPVQTCNPSAQKAETGGSQVHDLPELHNQTLKEKGIWFLPASLPHPKPTPLKRSVNIRGAESKCTAHIIIVTNKLKNVRCGGQSKFTMIKWQKDRPRKKKKKTCPDSSYLQKCLSFLRGMLGKCPLINTWAIRRKHPLFQLQRTFLGSWVL